MENKEELPGGEPLKGPRTLGNKPSLIRPLGISGLNGFMNSVMSGLGQSDQILRAVVRFIAIDMMNVLVWSNHSLQMFFQNQAMLSNKAAIMPNLPVTQGVFSAIPFLSSITTRPTPMILSFRLSFRRTTNRAENSAIKFGLEKVAAVSTGFRSKFLHGSILTKRSYYVNR